ncbi:universal stress protein [Streptomyces globosus]|uniref:Universal stress protein n=1 Tax=Streptomyces globosus TaxID=68209 RepID=A0A344U930_9ACTN|nr:MULTISPECIES: universal stress protein [Streptomyces]AXE27401.1 universal stress protein [Streptomyces globosus]
MAGTGLGLRVVVGIDGSEPSYEALRWAVRYAAVIGGHVDAVAAYDLPGGVGWSAPAVDADFDAAHARSKMREELRTVAREARSDVRMEDRLVRGRPAEVLLAAAEGAEVLVVGSRGRGGFAGLTLGSVSQQCARHAPCPVVIVRRGTGTGADPAGEPA